MRHRLLIVCYNHFIWIHRPQHKVYMILSVVRLRLTGRSNVTGLLVAYCDRFPILIFENIP